MRILTAKRIIGSVLAALLALAPFASSAADVETRAASAVLLEAGTGKVLYAKEAHKKLPMASTTKVMTALVVLERCAAEELVTVTKEAYGTEGSSIYLELDEKLSVEDLLYGLMLASGNDAAVALAVHVAGSTDVFAELMNAKAVEIGALNTHFVTPNGLHDGEHYTTAYDLALISACALANPVFKTIVGTSYHRTKTGNVQRTFKNKNKILWQYEGGNGIKTGFTSAAGKCLSFAAERGGMQLVGVVLNCPDMFNDAMRVLNYGFEHYEMSKAVSAGDILVRVRVAGGVKNVLELVAPEDIMVPVEKGSGLTVQTRVTVDEGIRAPISAGQRLGSVELFDGTKLLVVRPLVAQNGIDAAGFGFYLFRLFGRWTA